jgi:hypothetical protein
MPTAAEVREWIAEAKASRDQPYIDKYSYIYRRNQVQRFEELLTRIEALALPGYPSADSAKSSSTAVVALVEFCGPVEGDPS